MISRVEMLANAYNVQFAGRCRYSAWESDEVSDFARSAQQLYRKMFDRDIDIITIHAGLECAVFSKKIKGLDAISIGPDMWDVHTTGEKLSISSTEREWKYLLELLKL